VALAEKTDPEDPVYYLAFCFTLLVKTTQWKSPVRKVSQRLELSPFVCSRNESVRVPREDKNEMAKDGKREAEEVEPKSEVASSGGKKEEERKLKS